MQVDSLILIFGDSHESEIEVKKKEDDAENYLYKMFQNVGMEEKGNYDDPVNCFDDEKVIYEVYLKKLQQ